jgi:hypothetical protein
MEGIAMADTEFRGVVLGSSWRRMHRFIPVDQFEVNAEAIARGELLPGTRQIYLAQPHELASLIRRSLFYFDKITLPTNNLVPLNLPGVEVLEAEGELEREHINIHLGPHQVEMTRRMIENNLGISILVGEPNPPELLVEFHRKAFLKRQAQQPNAWILASVGVGLEFSNEKPIQGYAMELIECVPMPLEIASYAKIIDFKRREKSALLDMRAALDDIYLQIANSRDPNFAAYLNTAKLKKAIEAVQVLIIKSGLPWYRQVMEVDLNPIDWPVAAMAGHEAAEWLDKWGVPSDIALAGGTMFAAALMFKRKQIQPPSQVGAGAFQYIHRAVQAEIIAARR